MIASIQHRDPNKKERRDEHSDEENSTHQIPQRHLKPSSGTARKAEDISVDEDVVRRVFSRSPTNLSVGGKASDQPKRTPVSQEEIDAIMLGGCI